MMTEEGLSGQLLLHRSCDVSKPHLARLDTAVFDTAEHKPPRPTFILS